MRRVLVGMSGGIDSSASALLLRRLGYDTIGIILKLWEYADNAGSGKCCTPKDVRDARKVSFDIDMPFYVLDYSADFAREVVDYFTNEYLAGRTPNPCIVCNHKIKFHFLSKHADEIGAPAIATGHYCRIKHDAAENVYTLHRGVDASRDQSYFLFMLNQNILRRLLFPVGDMQKSEVRELLREAGMPECANKGESREICFVANDNYANFVEERLGSLKNELIRPGLIVDSQGKVVGEHKGIHHFTVGQRKGIGASAATPLYVTKLDSATQTVHVGPKENTLRDGCMVRDISWISDQAPSSSELEVQLRYRSKPVVAKLEPTGTANHFQLHFKAKEAVVPTPGQAAVFYDGDRVLGGGWIV